MRAVGQLTVLHISASNLGFTIYKFVPQVAYLVIDSTLAANLYWVAPFRSMDPHPSSPIEIVGARSQTINPIVQLK